jgi:ankyrin repeat protein
MTLCRRSPLVLSGCASLVLFGALPTHGADSCGDIERNYQLAKSEIISVQMNEALFAAADADCGALARNLIHDGASLQARDRLGAMPLAHAARAGHPKMVEFFLGKDAPIDARNVAGSTALLGAADNEKPATVALLLAKGANPNLPGRSGVTPLIAAAFKGNERIVEDLLAHGADPDARDSTGKAAITYAAARGFDGVVQQLLDAGVDARLRYGNDLTALMWAAGHDEGVGAAAAARVIDLLVTHGAKLDDTDNRGRTALMIAAESGDAGMVDVLLRRGADSALQDKQGKTALDLAPNDGVRALLRADQSPAR